MQLEKPKLQKSYKKSGGIAETIAFLAVGLYKSDIGKLVTNVMFERIQHRFYQLTGKFDITEAEYLLCPITKVLFTWS